MAEQFTITEARSVLTTLPEKLAGSERAVAITRRGKPVLALMPWDYFEAIIETLEALGDEELTEELSRSLREADEGRLLDWSEVKEGLEP